MEIKQALGGYELKEFVLDTKAKDPEQGRNYWIKQIAELTGMKFMVIFGKVRNLPTNWIKDIYQDALTAEGKTAKIKKCWWLINKTKV